MTNLKKLQATNSRSDLAVLLGYKPKTLAYILFKKPEGEKYHQFTIPKRSGGEREICAPYPNLKHLQKRISEFLQDCIAEINEDRKISAAISHGFRRKHSIITNAACHKGKRFVFNADIADFFGAINFGRVRGFFIENRNFKLNPDVATTLAQIACYENSLPQGSPCSPVISNLIGHILDIRLAELAYKNGCDYSRYADDLTFSTNKKDFPSEIATRISEDSNSWACGDKLEKAIRRCGFAINAKKTRLQYRDSRQEVTGLVVNSKVSVQVGYRRFARAMVDSLCKEGKFHEKKSSTEFGPPPKPAEGDVQKLAGALSFINSVSAYRVKAALKNHPKEALPLAGDEKVFKKFLFFKNFHSNTSPIILLEGKTDSIYLRCAIKNLGANFPDIASSTASGFKPKIKFFNYSSVAERIQGLSGGTAPLAKFITDYSSSCKKIKAAGLKQPVIIVIDNDQGSSPIFGAINQIIKPLKASGNQEFYYLGANLYVIPIPWHDASKNTMIEHYFESSVLGTILGGKKFSFSNEFDIATQYGKRLFAEQVVKKNEKSISFSNFKPLLESIKLVIEDHRKH